MSLNLASPAFMDGQTIPPRYTADGDNLSPPLAWQGAPKNTRSFAMLCEDPDAPKGTWSHWVVYNIPNTAEELREGVPLKPEVQEGVQQGVNDFGNLGYGGPAPPENDSPHRYIFSIFALDDALDFDGRPDRQTLLDAMNGHVLAEAELTGMYSR
jgi:Raf kinase inhibitor-like YbhB/YbcL family protein